MMKKRGIFILFVLFLLVTISITNFCKGQTDIESSVEFLPGTKIVFVDANEAKKILATKDEYVKSYTAHHPARRLGRGWPDVLDRARPGQEMEAAGGGVRVLRGHLVVRLG